VPLSECVFFVACSLNAEFVASPLNSSGTERRGEPMALSVGWSVDGAVATCISVGSGPASAPPVESEAESEVGELVWSVPRSSLVPVP
jgi:hypothetical protein